MDKMREECKQKILLAYAMGSLWLEYGLGLLCTMYGTEYVAECIVELGLDTEDL